MASSDSETTNTDIKDYEVVCVGCNCNTDSEINKLGHKTLSKPYTPEYYTEIREFRVIHLHSKCHVRPIRDTNYKKDEEIREKRRNGTLTLRF